MKLFMLNVVVSLALVFTSTSSLADDYTDAGANLDKVIADSVAELNTIAKHNGKHKKTIEQLQLIIPALVKAYDATDVDKQIENVEMRMNMIMRLEELDTDKKIRTLADFEALLLELLKRKNTAGVDEMTPREKDFISGTIGLIEKLKTKHKGDLSKSVRKDDETGLDLPTVHKKGNKWEAPTEIDTTELEDTKKVLELARTSWQSCPSPAEMQRRIDVLAGLSAATQTRLEAVNDKIKKTTALKDGPDAQKPKFTTAVRSKLVKDMEFKFFATDKTAEKVMVDGKEMTIAEVEQLALETMVKDLSTVDYDTHHKDFMSVVSVNVGDLKVGDLPSEATDAFNKLPLMTELQKKTLAVGSFQFTRFNLKNAEKTVTDLADIRKKATQEYEAEIKAQQIDQKKETDRLAELKAQSDRVTACSGERNVLDKAVARMKRNRDEAKAAHDKYDGIRLRAEVLDAPALP